MRHYLIIILIILIIGIISCEPEQVVEVSWEKYNKIGEMPINRSEHSMAYVGNGRLIMFGGYNNNDEYLKDTWEYDLATHTWTEYNTEAIMPQARNKHAMAYVGNGRLIMFGGYDSNKKSLSDTWECSAGSLTDKMTYEKDVPIMYVDKTSITYNDILLGDTSQESFSISNYGTASFDWSVSTAYAGDGKIVMFGGYGKNALDGVSSLADTWKYDYDTRKWTMVVCKTSPESRYYHSMAYAGEGKIVMFGGKCISGDESNLLSDTWIYDVSNNTWTEVTSAETNPKQAYAHSMAYIGDGKVIMFDTDVNSSWMFDTTNNANIWKKYDIPQHMDKPASRTHQSMSYIGNGKVIMFGGEYIGTRFNDMWEYDGGNLVNEMNN